jgi:hypothetical protein
VGGDLLLLGLQHKRDSPVRALAAGFPEESYPDFSTAAALNLVIARSLLKERTPVQTGGLDVLLRRTAGSIRSEKPHDLSELELSRTHATEPQVLTLHLSQETCQ